MSIEVERKFPAKALMLGLRSIGYSFSTAVADIIDNSISAEASEIKIYSDPLHTNPYFCVLDNGHGMDGKELNNAMLPGSDRNNVEDSELELGRFGLGLKSASLSQCREFIVATKKYGRLKAMSFDLDLIEERNKLFLKEWDETEINLLPHILELKQFESGTLVIWTKFDKIEALAKNFEDSFRQLVADSKKHVELVFHRFYDDIYIYFNGKRVERRDPFLLASHGRQQTGRRTIIQVDGRIIQVIPYTLPFAKTLTAEEKALLGNPKSIYDDQGFYLYRNKRLISWGNWLRMGIRSELNKLARIQVDIPSSLDSVWMLDVKKSSAKIPDKIKDQLRMAVEDSLIRSKRTIKTPGVKEASPQYNVWDRINEHDGNVRYEINRENPLIIGLEKTLNHDQIVLLNDLLSQLEKSIPKYRIHNDVIDSINIVNDILDTQETELVQQLKRCIDLFPINEQRNVFERLLASEQFLRLADCRQRIEGEIFHGR